MGRGADLTNVRNVSSSVQYASILHLTTSLKCVWYSYGPLKTTTNRLLYKRNKRTEEKVLHRSVTTVWGM